MAATLRPCGTDVAMKTLEVLTCTTAIVLSHIPTGYHQDRIDGIGGLEGRGRKKLRTTMRGEEAFAKGLTL